jgi:hypothetical protein
VKPEPRVFTKDNPCTKLDIWNCFRGPNGFVAQPVVEAQTFIGANVPRVMEREGRLVKKTIKNTDYYVLTEAGEEWLAEGFARYLKNHPSHASQAVYLPRVEKRLRRSR